MTLTEIERVQKLLKTDALKKEDVQSVLDEALKFHHKVSELQQRLILIKKQCQLEMKDLESGKPVSRAHVELLLESIVHIIIDSQHVKAA